MDIAALALIGLLFVLVIALAAGCTRLGGDK